MFSRNKTGQEGDEGPVGPSEAGTGDLPVQHGQLVAEYEDLSVLGRGIHPMDANDLNDAPDETVEEGQGHDRQASPSVLRLVKLGQGVFGPFTHQLERVPPRPGANSACDFFTVDTIVLTRLGVLFFIELDLALCL